MFSRRGTIHPVIFLGRALRVDSVSPRMNTMALRDQFKVIRMEKILSWVNYEGVYINNSLHLARKYAQIFVRRHYLFREANSELRGTDNVQGQISEHIFAAKLRLLCSLSIGFKNWGFSWGIFAHVTRLDQSRACENI